MVGLATTKKPYLTHRARKKAETNVFGLCFANRVSNAVLVAAAWSWCRGTACWSRCTAWFRAAAATVLVATALLHQFLQEPTTLLATRVAARFWWTANRFRSTANGLWCTTYRLRCTAHWFRGAAGWSWFAARFRATWFAARLLFEAIKQACVCRLRGNNAAKDGDGEEGQYTSHGTLLRKLKL